MPTPTQLVQALRQRRAPNAAVNGWLSLPGGLGAELAARAGYDCLTLDMQHGMLDFSDVLTLLQAAGTVGTPCLVRVPSAFDHVPVDVAMKVLDAGAAGIIAPQMDTPQIARQIVAACRYPPMGQRSFGPLRASVAGYTADPSYSAEANANVLVFGMIESAQALLQLDEILDTPGLDGIYIGPNDLSLSLGAPPMSEPTDERVVAAIERVRVAAQQRGLRAGIFCSGGDAAALRVAQGFDWVTPANDAAALAQGHALRLSAARANIRRYT